MSTPQDPQPEQIEGTATETTPPKSGDIDPVKLTYILYFIGFFFPIAALAGVILAQLNVDKAEPLGRSHYIFLIRTFWWGLGMSIVGGILALVLIGYLIIGLWLLWTLIRCIVGFLKILDGHPIENPRTLWW